MATRVGNIYPIRRVLGIACLIGLCAALLGGPAPAMAQCEDVGGAGDQYCEGLPGAGREQGVRKPRVSPGVSESTGRALERAGAGAVQAIGSPRSDRRAQQRLPAASSGSSRSEEPDDASALPYILGALTLAMAFTALALRKRRRAAAPGETAEPAEPA